MPDPTPIPAEALEAAALAISRYDWNNAISANGEVSRHQHEEARVAVEAAAPILLAAGRTAAAEDIRAKAETLDWYEGSGVWAQAIEIAQGPITENGDDRG